MTASIGKYTNDLLFALRMRDVPGDRIGEVIAEVESHVAETGRRPARRVRHPGGVRRQLRTAQDQPAAPLRVIDPRWASTWPLPRDGWPRSC